MTPIVGGLLGLLVAIGLALATLAERRAHRVAVEKVLHDYALIAGTEAMHRVGFDIGFDGYDRVAINLRRQTATEHPSLPPAMYPPARALVAHLLLIDRGVVTILSGPPPAPALLAWSRAEAARPPPSAQTR